MHSFHRQFDDEKWGVQGATENVGDQFVLKVVLEGYKGVLRYFVGSRGLPHI